MIVVVFLQTGLVTGVGGVVCNVESRSAVSATDWVLSAAAAAAAAEPARRQSDWAGLTEGGGLGRTTPAHHFTTPSHVLTLQTRQFFSNSHHHQV